MSHNDNLFVALRDAFPAQRGRTAIETADGPGAPLFYTWADIDRATAMIANLLASLQLPSGARVAVQTEKSVEALLLYLAVLRAGYVFLPLNTAYQAAEIEYFIGNAEPSVVVCSGKNFGWVSKIAFKAGTRHVFTLNEDRSGTLLERAAWHADRHEPAVKHADDLAAILYTSGTTGRSKGAMLTHGNLLSNARVLKSYWGWTEGDVLIHALPIFHVHGLFVASHGALLNGSKMIWLAKFDPAAVVRRLPEATVFMGVPTLYVRLLAEPGFTREACRRMRLFVAGSAPLLIETFNEFRERTGHTIPHVRALLRPAAGGVLDRAGPALPAPERDAPRGAGAPAVRAAGRRRLRAADRRDRHRQDHRVPLLPGADPARPPVAYIYNPKLTPELLQTVCQEFGISLPDPPPATA
jgi:malonyl-CoA/methylmalonyl-CoA synthetase